MLKALIVDDEPLARENIRLLLNEFANEIEVIAECKNATEALKAVDHYRLDVVFLDIQMPGMSGIKLAEKIKEYNLQIVFVTAHDEYAVKAFRLSALDYLLKPVELSLLQEVIHKLKLKTAKQKLSEQLRLYNSSINKQIEQIALPTLHGLEICKLADIVCLNADESYTEIILADKTKKIVSRKMGELEEMLNELGFVRVHKSHIINVKHIVAYNKGEGGSVKLSNGITVDVSRRKKEELLKQLNLV